MRKIKLALLMLTMGVLSLGACKKDEETKVNKSTFSAKVNGTLKESSGNTNVSATYLESEKALQISAEINSEESFSILLLDPKVGTFDLASDDHIVSYHPSDKFEDGCYAENGTVTISSFTNDVVKGTFNFNSDDKVITEGKFEIKLLKL